MITPSAGRELSPRMRLIDLAAKVIPRGVLRRIIERSVGDLGVAVCLHRVGLDTDDEQLLPWLAHDPDEIDELIDLFSLAPGHLTVSFDDGYEDACRYVLDRAPKHPDVNWLYMVCPKRTVDRRGFPWDLWVLADNERAPLTFLDDWEEHVDTGALEYDDAAAVGVAEHPSYLLATVEQCRELATIPNVELGNHTDHHVAMAWLDDDELAAEIRQSEAAYGDTFGELRHLALPFGCEPFVRPADIDRVCDVTAADIVWTIESWPFDPAPTADRDADGPSVRARFGWSSNGLPPRGQALYMALQSLRARRGR